EALAEAWRDVARGAAKAEHRILFVGLVALAAEELAVLVRLEVGEAHDHRLGPERGRDRGDAFDHLFDEERTGVRIAARRRLDLAPERRLELCVLDAGAR